MTEKKKMKKRGQNDHAFLKKTNNKTARTIIELERPIRRRNEFSKEFVQ